MTYTYSDELMLQPQQVATLLEDNASPKILPVFVGSEAAFQQAHLPGSIQIEPAALVCGIAPAHGKIPDVDDLIHLFRQMGLTPDITIIAYDDEGGGWAGRLIWTLDIIGHTHYHYLDGGIHSWLVAQMPIEQGRAPERTHTEYTFSFDTQKMVTTEQLINLLHDRSIDVWDARSAPEYNGEKIIAARGGHMPGAVNLDWLELMDRSNALRLKPLDSIRATLDARGINGTKPIVTHCQTHHRSGLTYLVGKLLGWNIRAYDGSWSEWGNRNDTPIAR